MSQQTDEPSVKKESPEAAGAEPPPQTEQDKDDDKNDGGPLSEQDALQALRGKGEDEAERAEAARLASIAASFMEQLTDDSRGMRIGTVALFNDKVDFGGGFNIGGEERRARPAKTTIRPPRLARWTEGYVPVPRFDKALRILAEHRLLILALPPGGRRATSLNLLARVLRDHQGGACFEVYDASKLSDGQWKSEADSGYLVHDGVATGLDPSLIDEQWIEDMTVSLHENKSYLVLVTGPPRGALVQAGGGTAQVLTDLGQLDAIRLIERRVLGRGPAPEESAELRRRLDEAGAHELLREDHRPRTALRLGDAIREGADLAACVQELRNPTGRVHEWFTRHRTSETVSFALAAAVLDGATYLTVSDAAAALYERLVLPVEAPFDLRFREHIATEHPWVRLLPGSGETPGDVAPRVRYDNPLVRQAVLGFAWTYLDGQRSALVRWMRQLVTHADIDVRARVSVAAGIIAWSDYSHALHRYLMSWAENPSLVVRQSAATALDVAGGHPHLTEAVWLLLETWVAEADTAEQRRRGVTAAATLGGSLGVAQPERAVEALRVLLDREDDWGTLLPVGSALFRLVEGGCTGEVLAGLLAWSQPRTSAEFVAKALSAFVFLAARPAESAGTSGVPLLLAGAERHRPELTELWARALDRKPAQDQALETLRDYLDEHADRDNQAYRNARRLVLAVADRSERHRERLRHHLGAWTRATGRPDHPTARVLADLTRPSHVHSYGNGRS
ncbi:hypothetical protein [Nonomuraea candida]|uniref:hypothetical protein n=1 Tax=Nonomuraea candida TaxID=359159 RepID=UPI000693B1CE|nr:hypothetical protein [Nonomuraea candida]